MRSTTVCRKAIPNCCSRAAPRFPRCSVWCSASLKLEGGARSALDPNTTASAAPYICEELGDGWSLEAGNLHVIEPERTCLDKILILHAMHCGYRDKGRLPRDGSRISRHYYDVAMLAATDVGKAALANKELFADVREHGRISFPSAWRRYDQAVPGSLRLVPQDALRAVLEKDFEAMQGMMFGDIPSFDWVTSQIEIAEQAINGGCGGLWLMLLANAKLSRSAGWREFRLDGSAVRVDVCRGGVRGGMERVMLLPGGS